MFICFGEKQQMFSVSFLTPLNSLQRESRPPARHPMEGNLAWKRPLQSLRGSAEQNRSARGIRLKIAAAPSLAHLLRVKPRVFVRATTCQPLRSGVIRGCQVSCCLAASSTKPPPSIASALRWLTCFLVLIAPAGDEHPRAWRLNICYIFPPCFPSSQTQSPPQNALS